MYIKTKHIWMKGLESSLPFIETNDRNLTQGCTRNLPGQYRQHISIMRSRDVYLYKSLIMLFELAAMNWPHDLQMESYMIPIGSEGWGASWSHADHSSHTMKLVNLSGSGRNAVGWFSAIMESSKVYRELHGTFQSIVKWYKSVWQPSKPQGGSEKAGARPGMKLYFSDVPNTGFP
jgi:hypothetical protein